MYYNDDFRSSDQYRYTNRDQLPHDDYAPGPNRAPAPAPESPKKQGFFHRTAVKVTALILACAVCFTIHILVIDHFTAYCDGVKLSCLQFLFAALISTVCMFLFEDVDFAAIWGCILPLLYVGIFSCGVGYTLQILAQKGSNPTVVTILLSLESVFAVIAGAIILKQQMSAREYIGCAVMFAAVLLAQIDFPVKQKAE